MAPLPQASLASCPDAAAPPGCVGVLCRSGLVGSEEQLGRSREVFRALERGGVWKTVRVCVHVCVLRAGVHTWDWGALCPRD